jgi:homospermidine synthase
MIKNISDKHIILFGVGAVQKCILHYIDKYLNFNPINMLMIDLLDYRTHPDVKKWTDKGAQYVICDINKEYKRIISKLQPYDIVIDLSNRTDSLNITEECLKANVHYINTSLEDPISPNEIKRKEETLKGTYQHSHNIINTLKNKYKDNATILLCAGENPGAITMMHKLAIKFLAKKEKKTQDLNLYLNEKDWGRLCKYLKVSVIHCSETDSARFNEEHKMNQFNNTWCCQGLIDEYSDDVQMTWGTNQDTIPKKAEMMSDHVINFEKPSKDIYCESYVPKNGKFIGVCISHSEQISGADWFSTPDYSPTMHYVYRLSPITQDSIKKMNKNLIGSTFPKDSTHVLNNYDDKFDGEDIVGSLVLTEDGKAVWAGSLLSNNEKHIGLHSGTTAQVAVSVLSFIHWIFDNKNKGANFCEVVDEEYFLRLIKPYYNFWCGFVDYKPNSLQFKDLQRTKKDYDNQFK